MKKANLELDIVKLLSDKKLDRTDLKRYSTQIAGLQKKSFIVDRVCKYGIPVDRGICVQGRLSIGNLKGLIDIIKIPSAHGFELFPLGKLDPTVLSILFRIGPENVGR